MSGNELEPAFEGLDSTSDLYCRAAITHTSRFLTKLPVTSEAHVAILSCDACPMQVAISTNKPEGALGSESETAAAKEVLSLTCGRWIKGYENPGKMPNHLLSKVRVVQSPT